uniref:Glutathione peroxidase n=1 Tax=Oreochromis niloticus TaxID=8128 RepID=A0A669DQP4_ORENI
MHAKYAERGLSILAFPSNQFGNQEPGNETQIKQFADTFSARFDMFSKIEVNGQNAHPLWKWLKEQPNGKGFFYMQKYVIIIHLYFFCVVKRYGPLDDPSVRTKPGCSVRCSLLMCLCDYCSPRDELCCAFRNNKRCL